MRLIFNISNKGSEEIKALIPYVDKDLKFDNLIPDLKTATNDVINLVGKNVYQILEDIYHNSIATPLTTFQNDFRIAIAYPIATNGYRLYAPTNDLAHTNNGRKMRGDDNEKVPFEHLLDRDNANQEKRYYRALDALIQFLDDIPKFDNPTTAEQTFQTLLNNAWRNSEAYQELNSLFIASVNDFNRFFKLESRLLLLKLSPGMADCEQSEILPRIGATKFNELKTKQKEGQAIAPSDLPLLKLIKQACVYHSLAWSMMRFSVNLYPDGILQHYTSDKATTRGQKPSLNIEPKAAEMAFTEDCRKALLQIENIMAPKVVADPNISIQPIIISGNGFISA
jgi:hypothetical protein